MQNTSCKSRTSDVKMIPCFASDSVEKQSWSTVLVLSSLGLDFPSKLMVFLSKSMI